MPNKLFIIVPSFITGGVIAYFIFKKQEKKALRK